MRRRARYQAHKLILWNLKDVLLVLGKLFGHLITALRFTELEQEIRAGSVIVSIKLDEHFEVQVDTCPTNVLIEHPETEVVVTIDDDTGAITTARFKEVVRW